MNTWIRITAWTLIPFGLLGLMGSVVLLSAWGVGINALLILIGWLDLQNLRRAGQKPSAWRSIALTQGALGLLVGGSLAWLGFSLVDSPGWDAATKLTRQLYGNPPGMDEALVAMESFFKWAMLLCGLLILLSQVWLAQKLLRLARTPPRLDTP